MVLDFGQGVRKKLHSETLVKTFMHVTELLDVSVFPPVALAVIVALALAAN